MSTFTVECPLPSPSEHVELGHGGGGRMTRRLLEDVFWAELGTPAPSSRHDGAVVPLGAGRPVLTTDAFVVKPLFFPGGDIGQLAVFGTVNDLAMCGAIPRHLTASFILEEGLEIQVLRRVLRSMRDAAAAVGVEIVAGDTKVVARGHGDKLFIAMSGLGWVPDGISIEPGRVQPGDALLVSGDIGRHGVAVLSAREGLSLDGELRSDCRELVSPVRRLLDASIDVHCLRDLTRGGLAAATWEIARDGQIDLTLHEAALPVVPSVRGAAELFGFDVTALPCEGRFLAFVPETQAARALDLLRAETDQAPARVGSVVARCSTRPARVTLLTALGTERILDLPHGELLPRIC